MTNTKFASVVCVAIICCVLVAKAKAQNNRGDPASWQWQASSDNGQTWSSGMLQVNAGQSNVKIRGVVSFPSELANAYFGGILFDPYVEGIGNSGLTDTISDIAWGQIRLQFSELWIARFGNRIKIDSPRDSLPPGEGPYWAQTSQIPPSTPDAPVPAFDNPINVFEYTINLDGTLGDRLVTAAWATDTLFGYRPYMLSYVYDFDHRSQRWRHQLTEQQLTIRVVPGPGLLSLAPAIFFVARRRRRWHGGASSFRPSSTTSPTCKSSSASWTRSMSSRALRAGASRAVA